MFLRHGELYFGKLQWHQSWLIRRHRCQLLLLGLDNAHVRTVRSLQVRAYTTLLLPQSQTVGANCVGLNESVSLSFGHDLELGNINAKLVQAYFFTRIQLKKVLRSAPNFK